MLLINNINQTWGKNCLGKTPHMPSAAEQKLFPTASPLRGLFKAALSPGPGASSSAPHDDRELVPHARVTLQTCPAGGAEDNSGAIKGHFQNQEKTILNGTISSPGLRAVLSSVTQELILLSISGKPHLLPTIT